MKNAREPRVEHTPRGWRLRGPGSAGANRFLDRISLRGLAESSRRTYAFDMPRLLRWLRERGLRPEALRHEDYYSFISDLRDQLRPPTINRLLVLLHRWVCFLRPGEAPRRRRRSRRARCIPRVREPRVQKRPLTDRQVTRMARELRTDRDRAALGLMWALGLRVGEVLRLCWEDVDWQERTVHVHGKGNRERSLPLPEVVVALLRRYQLTERPAGCTAGAVFVVLKGPRRGRPMTYAGMRRIFRYHRARLRLPEAHPHRFRHTFAVNMIRQGMSVPSLMRLLGHTWPETTMRYVHFDDREVRRHYEEALRKLSRNGPELTGEL